MSRFSRELKDFVAGIQSGQKIMDNLDEGQLRKKKMALADEQVSAARHANSPEQRALGVDVKRAAINASNATTALRGDQGAYWRAAAQPVAPAAPAAITVNVPDIPGLADGGAVPTREELLAAARAIGERDPHIRAMESALPPKKTRPAIPMEPLERPHIPMEPGVREHLPEGKLRKRSVKAYDDGGAVEADDDDDTFDTGVSAAEEAVLAGAGDAYAQATTPAPAPAAPAPRAAIPTQATMPPPKPVAAPRPRMPSLQQRRSMAAPPDQVKEVETAVKDAYGKKYGDKLSPSYLKVLTLGTVYKHFYDQGDLQSAERVRSQLAQAYFMESDRYGAVARAAAEGGNADEAAKAMTQAYAAIPSGMSFHVTKKGDNYQYTFSDEKSGEDITKGIWSPKQLLAKAVQMSEEGAEMLVLGSKKVRDGAKEAKGKAPKEPTLRDLEGARKDMDSEFDRRQAVPGVDGAEGDKVYTLDKGSEDATANVATQIRVDNPRLSPRDAAYAAYMLSQSGGKLPNVVSTGEDGSRVIQLDDGRPVKISRDAWLQAAASKKKGRLDDIETRMNKAGEELVKERETTKRDTAREKIVERQREKVTAAKRTRMNPATRDDPPAAIPEYRNDEE